MRAQRVEYDATGRVSKTVEEDFADAFAGGMFRDRGLHPEAAAETTNISERITVRKEDNQSHTAGFEVPFLITMIRKSHAIVIHHAQEDALWMGFARSAGCTADSAKAIIIDV